MTDLQKDKTHLLEQYLLGELSPTQQDDLETAYFDDDELFSQLATAEDRLIEDYCQNRLNPAKRERFEKFYLNTPQRRRRVLLVEQLQGKEPAPTNEAIPAATEVEGRTHREASRPWWQKLVEALIPANQGPRYGLAYAMTMLLIVAIGFSIYTQRRLRQEQDALAALQRKNSDDLAALHALRLALGNPP